MQPGASSSDRDEWIEALLGAEHGLATLILSEGRVVAANAAADLLFERPIVGVAAVQLFAGPSGEKLERALAARDSASWELIVARAGVPASPMRFTVVVGPRGLRALVAVGNAEPSGHVQELLAMNMELARLARELSRRNRDLAHAKAEVTRAAEAQELLTAVVGHDLRTPLSAISMSVSVLMKAQDLSDGQRVTLGRIAASADRMTAIVNDVLDFSRARRGEGLTIRKQEADVGELCRRTLDEFASLAPGIARTLSIEGQTTAAVDPARLAQALSNLVANAIEHGGASPVDVTVRGTDEDVVVSVHNLGPPIPASVLPDVFDPFRRGRAAPGGADRGLGLGLFIVKEVVRGHGGTVRVDSDREAGTTFTLRLPRR